MIVPERAPVRPRVSVQGGEQLPLEDEVLSLVEQQATGVVALVGPHGVGKTTALCHLAAVLPADVVLLDEPAVREIEAVEPDRRLVIYAARQQRTLAHLAVYPMASWTDDDCLEYLLGQHRSHCNSVMTRLRSCGRAWVGGVPEVWRPILDQLANDPAIPDTHTALRRHLEGQLVDTDLLTRVRSVCLEAVVTSKPPTAEGVECWTRPGFAEGLVRLIRQAPVQRLLAAERIRDDLREEGACDYFVGRLPRPLIEATAELARGDERCREHLLRLMQGPEWAHAMAASLLHALGIGWFPGEAPRLRLKGAYLSRAKWSGINLFGAILDEADLSRADLSHGKLFPLSAADAVLSHTILSGADLTLARLHGACLVGADLRDTCLSHANLGDADLTDADLCGANLSGASLLSVKIAGARFDGADLSFADLSGLVLREASFAGARFDRAALRRCDLEGMDLSGVSFAGSHLELALLTGTRMHHADLTGANLSHAGLAEIDWENVSLRGANLTGASFHLGSTRSGLVGSPIASEGSRTGFYTDDYHDNQFKTPEEVRKANLCGADLRGAVVDKADFYLVDLRGAKYDPEQETHFRRCGAILEGWTPDGP